MECLMLAFENVFRDWKGKWFLSVLLNCLVDTAQVEGELCGFFII